MSSWCDQFTLNSRGRNSTRFDSWCREHLIATLQGWNGRRLVGLNGGTVRLYGRSKLTRMRLHNILDGSRMSLSVLVGSAVSLEGLNWVPNLLVTALRLVNRCSSIIGRLRRHSVIVVVFRVGCKTLVKLRRPFRHAPPSPSVEVQRRASSQVILVKISGDVVNLSFDDLLDASNTSTAARCGAVEVLAVRSLLKALNELSCPFSSTNIDHRRTPRSKALVGDSWGAA